MVKAPFPYFGGKRLVASEIWRRFGAVDLYIEPFFGSGAVLLSAPYVPKRELVNDMDCFLVNVWRGIKHHPEEVARLLQMPITEIDQNARHLALMANKSRLREQLLVDPEYCDVRLAAFWVYGICCWIGSGFCSGRGKHGVVDGKLVTVEGEGTAFQLPKISGGGNGVLTVGFDDRMVWLQQLAARLARTQIVCGDWSRVVKPSVITEKQITAIMFDPPYFDDCATDVYSHNVTSVAGDVQRWCLENGDRESLRIVLCGYEGEHNCLEEAGWQVFEWKANGGFGNMGGGRGAENRHRERLWFSPHCLPEEASVFDLFGG